MVTRDGILDAVNALHDVVYLVDASDNNSYRLQAHYGGLEGESRAFQARDGGGNMLPHVQQAILEAKEDLAIKLMVQSEQVA